MVKFNRDALKRDYRTSVSLVFFALALMTTTIVGNLVQTPIILLLWGVTLIVLTTALVVYQNQPLLLRWTVYLYDNMRWVRRFKWTRNGDALFIRRIKELNKQAFCVWVKDDDVSVPPPERHPGVMELGSAYLTVLLTTFYYYH